MGFVAGNIIYRLSMDGVVYEVHRDAKASVYRRTDGGTLVRVKGELERRVQREMIRRVEQPRVIRFVKRMMEATADALYRWAGV